MAKSGQSSSNGEPKPIDRRHADSVFEEVLADIRSDHFWSLVLKSNPGLSDRITSMGHEAQAQKKGIRPLFY